MPAGGGARAAPDRGRPTRRSALAEELETLNRERQAIEERICREAIDQIESWPESRRGRRGYVVAGEGWHEGVIGIVASRLVERYNRPGRDDRRRRRRLEGLRALGRRRSTCTPALAACSGHLQRFGGHRAAAGLTIERGAGRDVRRGVRRALPTRCSPTTTCGRVTRVDAIVAGREARRSASAPSSGGSRRSGIGNPGVTLLVDGCELADLDTVGDGKHLRFRVRQRGRDAGSAIAFGLGAQLDRFRRDRAATTSPSGCRRTAGTAPSRRSSSSGASSTRPTASTSCATGSPTSGGRGEAAWTPEARAIFAELELDERRQRSLLESPTFRALLEQRPALAAAA